MTLFGGIEAMLIFTLRVCVPYSISGYFRLLTSADSIRTRGHLAQYARGSHRCASHQCRFATTVFRVVETRWTSDWNPSVGLESHTRWLNADCNADWGFLGTDFLGGLFSLVALSELANSNPTATGTDDLSAQGTFDIVGGVMYICV